MGALPFLPPTDPIPEPKSYRPPEPWTPPVSRRRRGLGWLWAVLFLVAAGAAGYAGWRAWSAARMPPSVLTAQAVRGDLPIVVTERGELESAKSVQVICEVEGEKIKLVSILPEGTQVSKGQEVAKYDTEAIQRSYLEQEVKWKLAEGKARAAKNELDVAINKRESEIDKADLTLKLAKLDRDMYIQGEYQVDDDEKNGAIELAKKDQKEAEDNVEFTRNLVKRGFATMEQLRVKELELQQKRYLVSRDEAKLRVLREFGKRRKVTELEAKARDADRELERTRKSQDAAVEKATSEHEAADSTAKLEKQQLERLKLQLERCVVRAPEDGIVVYFKRPWDEESRIRPGAILFFQQPIFSLPDLSKMKVKVKIHESVIKKVKPGQKTTITIDALPNVPLTGTVETVATLAQSEGWRGGGVKEYLTEVKVDHLPENGGLKPGMTAEVKVQIMTVPDVVMVPLAAVTERDGQNYSYVVTGSGVEKRPVKIGEANEQFVQIVDGLEEGESVALDARARAAAEAKKVAKDTGKEKEKVKQNTAPATPSPGGAS
jgi:HlyD family secretion protein